MTKNAPTFAKDIVLTSRIDNNTLPKDLQAILITAMKLSAYDMYAHSNDASAKNWATMKKVTL
jgi:TRAP-type mannitol/chloroaromatic compound transport system substrate-binding protein